MLENIKLKNNKGLREVTLESLGKINIFCGRNNSGKSTILGTLGGRRGIQWMNGRQFSKEDYEVIFKNTIRNFEWYNTDGHKTSIYKDLLHEIYNESMERIWYLDEGDIFADLVQKKCEKSNLVKSEFNKSIINAAVLSLFTDPKSILLPPKRNLCTSKAIISNESLSNDGSGILNYLFYSKNQSDDSARKSFYQKVSEAFTEISSGCKFEIFMKEDNLLKLYFSYESAPWRDANDCGLGLQDLLVIIFFAEYHEYETILIEEPEIHIHPDMQRRLIYHLFKNTEKQYFISTHSNVFLDDSLVEKIYFVYFEESIQIDDATSRASILNDIGYSITDNLVSDLIILTEGPTDRPVIEEFLLKMDLFNKYNIKFWPLGGDIMNQLDLSVFSERHEIIALVDRDPNSKKIRNKFVKNCKKYNIQVHRLKRYSLENYFTLEALRKVFKEQISEDLHELDPNKKVEVQIGLNPKKNNKKIAGVMTLEDIKDTDFYDFLCDVEKICKEHSRQPEPVRRNVEVV